MFGFNINFGGIDERFESFDCIIEVEVDGNKQRQRMQAPRIMIEQQFLSVCKEVSQMNVPAMARLSRMAQCRSDWFDEVVEREVYILFSNNLYKDCE